METWAHRSIHRNHSARNTDPAIQSLQEIASSMEGMESILHICFPQMVWNWDGRYATHFIFCQPKATNNFKCVPGLVATWSEFSWNRPQLKIFQESGMCSLASAPF